MRTKRAVNLIVFTACLFWLAAVAGAQDSMPTTAPASGPDHTDPASVVQAVFTAAQTGDFAVLGGLCDPAGENDGDMRRICELAQEPAGSAEFVEYFAQGGVAGEIVIEGQQANVPIRFGPGGERDETMVLIQREGLWYLYSF